MTGGVDATNAWSQGRGGFRIDSDASPQNTLTLQGDFHSGNENQSLGGDTRTGGGNILGRWSHSFSDESDMSLQLYYDRTHIANPVAKSAFAPAGILVDDLDTYDLDFQHRLRLGERNEFEWGLSYRFIRDAATNAKGLAFLPDRLSHSLFGAFAQDRITLTSDLFLTLGTKLEHNGYTGFETEPSGRLQWNLSNGQMLWGAISRAVRTPSRVDRDLYQPNPPPAILAGNSGFKSETVIAYEVGYRAQLREKVSGSISAFYNDYSDIRSLSYTPATIIPFYFENNLEGHTYGVELSAKYQVLAWWRLHGGYNFLKENIRVKAGRVDLNNALNETADPEQQFSLRSSMDLPHGVELDAGLRWVDTLRNNNNGVVGTVPSYFELDARVGWNVTKGTEASIVGQNLLHRHHAEYGVPGPGREEVERGVYGKVSWRF